MIVYETDEIRSIDIAYIDKIADYNKNIKYFIVAVGLCGKKGIKTLTTESEKKSVSAERNIRSLKSVIYKYLEDKWTYSYIDKLHDFVNKINLRTNRVIKFAPNKLTKKDVPRLILLGAD